MVHASLKGWLRWKGTCCYQLKKEKVHLAQVASVTVAMTTSKIFRLDTDYHTPCVQKRDSTKLLEKTMGGDRYIA